LLTVEAEKTRKYELLAKELGMIYKCKARVIPYVMTWDGVVTIYHKKYLRELGIPHNIEAYMQTRVLKTTLGVVSFEHRRGILDGLDREDEVGSAVERMCATAAGGIEA
jgi:hypothetical protein